MSKNKKKTPTKYRPICFYYQHPFFSAFVYKSVSIPRPSGILVVEFIYAMRESLNGRIAGYAFDVRAMIVAHNNLIFEIAILVFHFFALFLRFGLFSVLS